PSPASRSISCVLWINGPRLTTCCPSALSSARYAISTTRLTPIQKPRLSAKTISIMLSSHYVAAARPSGREGLNNQRPSLRSADCHIFPVSLQLAGHQPPCQAKHQPCSLARFTRCKSLLFLKNRLTS